MIASSPFTLRTALISLIATPWLILITTSTDLYLRNQAELHYRFDVLYPFLGVALVVFLAGTMIASPRPRCTRNIVR